MTRPTASLVVIGNEILCGRTREANGAYIAQRCDELGIRLAEIRVVADQRQAIVEAVNACRQRYDTVFTTGGIGPTHDDITTDSIAHAFAVPVVRSETAVRMMQQHYGSADLNEARLRMADVPQGCRLIDNPVSGAPGYRIGNVVVMAGVPDIMQAMFESQVADLSGGQPVLTRTVATSLMESRFAIALERLQKDFDDVDIGSYPFAREGRFGVKLVLRGSDDLKLIAAESAINDMLARVRADLQQED